MPLHLLVGGVVVASMLLLAAALIWQGWSTSHAALRAAARENAQDIGRGVGEKIGRVLEPAQAMLSQLTLDPITGAATFDQRLARLPALVQVLRQSPLISVVYVGYRDGDFFLVRPLDADSPNRPQAAPDGTRYLVQSITRDGAGRPAARRLFLDTGLRPLGDEALAHYTIDPRTRPWFANAAGAAGQQLTEPYLFYTTGQIGITLSQAAAAGGAVIGLDLALTDLSRKIAGLRHTPRSEIAVIDAADRLVAYTGSGKAQATPLAAIAAAPALAALKALDAQPGQEVSFEQGGELWHGLGMPLDILPGSQLRVLVAVPDADLLGSMRRVLSRQGWSTLIVILSMLPLGWLASRQISRELTHLSHRARQLTRFDFDAQEQRRSIVREVKDMHDVFGTMRQTIHNFLLTTHMISREPRMDRMLDGVLQMLVASTRSTSGAVYLLEEADAGLALEASCATPGNERPEPAQHLSMADMRQLEADAAGRLAVRLTGRHGELLGMLVLHYEADDAHRSRDFRAFAVNLSGAIAVSVETRMLIDSQQRLFHAVVRLLADAIDAKSPYTSGHCERVPEIADAFIDRLCAEREGPYAGFRMSEAERYEFRVGAWLHDCGKITSPEHVIDKATKLEAIYNRIHVIRTRFEVLWRDAVIEHQQRLLRGEDEPASLARLQALQRELTEEFAFVAGCNIGGESMTEEAMARLRAIGSRTWMRHFDDRLGLSRAELDRHAGRPPAELPAPEQLLMDRPEHVVPWGERRPSVERGDPANHWGFDMELPANAQNMGELYNLSIQRGTLTAEDRFRINDHIVQTYIMLCALPWPGHLARVPEIAATHHERMDGRGYPRKLGAEQLTLVDRVMALADVFEALTATDRPYTTPKKLSLVLRIMAGMARDGHLDAELFRYFLRKRVWEDFSSAQQRPDQFDSIDDAMIEELAQASASRAAA